MSYVLQTSLCFLLAISASLSATAQSDRIRASVDDAVVAFNAITDKSKSRIAVDLKRKRDRALGSGNLRLAEFVESEISILQNGDPSPEVLLTSPVFADIKRAQVKTSSVYANAIKASTKKGDIILARTLQAEFSIFEQRFNRMTDSRKFWKAEHLVFQQVDQMKWNEANATGITQYQFKEISRSSEFIELLDESRAVSIRLHANRSLVKGAGGDWRMHATGRWAEKSIP